MTTIKQYDYLNRLNSISSQPSGTDVPPVSFHYAYNLANQRTQDKLADGSYWVYQYDALGQVISGTKYFCDGTLVPGQQFGYSFDTIGNRTQTQAGGDQNGGSLRLANYSVNNLNQITNRDYPGTNDVIGVALATNSVTVNGQSAFHKWEYFRGTVGTNNTASAAWLTAAVGSGGSTNKGSLFIPQSPEHFSYDADGNLLSDGRWNYTWDAENRLVGMCVNTNVGPQYQLGFAYDAKGRRIQKNVTNGVSVSTINFLYDGWNLIATLSANSQLLSSYTWGSDLSGSMQGAGGVGGLLEVSYYGTSTTNCFPAFDGNGNVAALVNAADGTMSANYEYGPFGEVIRSTGPMAKANPFRFSTKYNDDETDLVYYGYRYFMPSTGTWTSRDPEGEEGGLNIFAPLDDDAINDVDYLGLSTVRFVVMWGNWRKPVSDYYSNPAGWGEGNAPGDTDGSTYAYTRVRIYSGLTWHMAGTCNTIWNPMDDCSGAIQVFYKGCAGNHTLHFYVDLKLNASGKVGRASATLRSGPLFYFKDKVNVKKPSASMEKPIDVPVYISNPDNEEQVLWWEPVIAMPNEKTKHGSWGQAQASISFQGED